MNTEYFRDLLQSKNVIFVDAYDNEFLISDYINIKNVHIEGINDDALVNIITRGNKDLYEGNDDMLVKDSTNAKYVPKKYIKFENCQIAIDRDTISVTPVVPEKAPKDYFIYGARINLADSNPNTATKLLDDCINNLPTGFGERPCVVKDCEVQYYLNPDDFTKKEDGTDAVLTGEDGDVMIEIPKLAYLIRRYNNYLEVKVTNHQNATMLDPKFCYKAFTREEEGDLSHIYIGAYQGSTVDGKFRSISDSVAAGSITMPQAREQAHANGAGYEILNWYQLMLLECMFVVKYGNLNGQAILGQGHTTGENYVRVTGVTNSRGMYYGSTSTTDPVKFAGLEDFWGKRWQWIEGLIVSSDLKCYTAFKDYTENGFDTYTYIGQLPNTNSQLAYNTNLYGNNDMGFFPITTGGASTSTYTCDGYWSKSGEQRTLLFGGDCHDGASCGPFCFLVGHAPSAVHVPFGARLCCFQP